MTTKVRILNHGPDEVLVKVMAGTSLDAGDAGIVQRINLKAGEFTQVDTLYVYPGQRIVIEEAPK